MQPTIEELLARATAWADADPDPVTAAEMRGVVDAVKAGADGAEAELRSRFSGPLEFGTAGLRAAIGSGESRMNIAVVRRTAAGISRFLKDTAAGAYVPRVIIGHDARHRSKDFAVESAGVFAAAGFEVLLMPTHLPTPVLSWGTLVFDADAGIMVTASHNPKEDNGYKVYVGGRVEPGLGKGAQIVPPIDGLIAAAIHWDEDLESIEVAGSGWSVLPDAGEPGDVEARYVADVVALSPAREGRDLKIVSTALHGVGGHTLAAVLRRAGYTAHHPVAEQEVPDPDFPTVAFPNPEEKGAMDLSLALAERVGADLVLANDPDADRMSAAIPSGTGWRQLRGDEVGVLLGDYLMRRDAAAGRTSVMGNSIVSSRQLSALCAQNGVSHSQVLTGFKWLARVPGLTFGYEEALGYDVAPHLTNDKDGISACLLLAELAQDLKDRGVSIQSALDAINVKTGIYSTDQISIRVAQLSERDVITDRLLSSPPAALGGSAVVSVDDMAEGLDGLPPTTGLRIMTEDNTRVIVRPSGTEPKLKCYLEVVEPVASEADLARADQDADAKLALIRNDLAGVLGL